MSVHVRRAKRRGAKVRGEWRTGDNDIVEPLGECK